MRYFTPKLELALDIPWAIVGGASALPRLPKWNVDTSAAA